MKQISLLKKSVVFTLFLFGALGVYGQEKKEKKSFEFTVTGMKSYRDAKSLDSLMLTKKGIYSSSTDYKTGTITVKTIPQLDFNTVKSVLTVLRLEATDKNLKVTTVTE
jgi:hypothetical protein